MTNKGTDKQDMADSFIGSTTCHIRYLYKFIKNILGQVVPEKSLTTIPIFITLE